jgi:hypothetical protein
LLNDSEDKVEFGPPINDAIATGMTKAASRTLPKEALDATKAKAKVPENAKLLEVPKVNPEVWRTLPNRARYTDLRLQLLSYGLVALSKIAEELVKNPHAVNSSVIMQHVKDGANLLGAGFQDISARRRMDIKQHIQPEYAGICSGKEVASEFLFGDNLDEELKKSKSASELMKKVGVNRRAFVPKPYSRIQNSTHLNFNRPSQDNRRGGHSRGYSRSNWRGPQQRNNSQFNSQRN